MLKENLRINREIRSEKVRVIKENGDHVGVMDLKEALELAKKERLDLIEVSPSARPPVCRLTAYDRFRYHRTKKEKENRKAQHQVKIKEIKFKPNIDVHDFQTKAKKARAMIEKGNKLRLTCTFRGREILHIDRGAEVLRKFCSELEDVATPEAPSKRVGRSLNMVLAPCSTAKKKAAIKKKEEHRGENDVKNENEKGREETL
ncbi:MAG: translation initiation factor IF-3 [Chlamydiota bacterium]